MIVAVQAFKHDSPRTANDGPRISAGKRDAVFGGKLPTVEGGTEFGVTEAHLERPCHGEWPVVYEAEATQNSSVSSDPVTPST